MSDKRTVTVDMTEQEARTVAAALDFASAFLSATGSSAESSVELRQRFMNGIVIAQAEQILYGAS